jgi:hypothetical protein
MRLIVALADAVGVGCTNGVTAGSGVSRIEIFFVEYVNPLIWK